VGGAFHSVLMADAEVAVAPLLRAVPLRVPRRSLISSVTGALVDDITAHRAALLHQITAPVRWRQAIGAARLLGARGCLEIGPGRVLSALTRSCDRSLRVDAVGDLAGCRRLENAARIAEAAGAAAG
jgi:malonyl CoA-acyl carrier protein transacylase